VGLVEELVDDVLLNEIVDEVVLLPVEDASQN
jgi:hypothetical protein